MRAGRATATLAAVALATALWALPPAHAQDTTAVVVNTHDGLEMFRVMFQVRRAAGDVVDGTNAAVAYSSCSECQSVAIAFQILLAGGGASTVSPENLAIAINQECTLCVSFASAYQFVLANGDGPVVFTAEGSQALADIRQRLQQLRGADLTPEQLDAELDAIADEIRTVLATELVSAGAPTASESPTSNSPTPTSTASDSPTSTSTPTQDDSETTAEPTTTETESETSTPSPTPTETTETTEATPTATSSTG